MTSQMRRRLTARIPIYHSHFSLLNELLNFHHSTKFVFRQYWAFLAFDRHSPIKAYTQRYKYELCFIYKLYFALGIIHRD